MRRRDFLWLTAPAWARQKEAVTATATQDKTPRVAIVLSSFRGSKDHDGTPIAGLEDPRPVTAKLTPVQFDAVVRKALEVGAPRRGGLETIVEAEDWVVILASPAAPPGVARSLEAHLRARGRGQRFTIASDLARDEFIETPLPGRDAAYPIAKTIQQCDRVVSVAGFQGDLSMGNYASIARGRAPLADLFAYHPADYAVLASGNLVIAGASAPAVDAVGAAVLGRDPDKIEHLRQAARLGFGIADPDLVWTRGNEIDEARKALQTAT